MWVHSISLSGADAGGAGGTQRRALQEASDLGGFNGLPYTYPWRWPDYETFMADPATSWAFLATSIGWAWGKGANGTQTSRVCLIGERTRRADVGWCRGTGGGGHAPGQAAAPRRSQAPTPTHPPTRLPAPPTHPPPLPTTCCRLWS